MLWPFCGLFLLVKSQTDEILQDTHSLVFSQNEMHDCSKIGCKGFDKDSVHSFEYKEKVQKKSSYLRSSVLPLNSQDSLEERVVLKVKDAEARNLRAAAARVCQTPGVNKPECLGEKPATASLEIELMDVVSKDATKETGEEKGMELRLHLFCMLLLISSCCFLRCTISLALAILGLLIVDQIVQWGNLVQCSRPMHNWFLGTYVCACALRLAFRLADQYLSNNNDMPWYLRRSKKWGPFPPVCLAAWVLVPLPFVTFWSVLGMSWLNDVLENSPESLLISNSHAQVAAVVTCLTLNSLGVLAGLIFVVYACIVSRSFAVGVEVLSAISDADFVERWGPPQPMLEEDFGSGLGPEEIASLPCHEVLSDSANHYGSNCAICLTAFAMQDRIRRLPNCKHEFHRPCIDQWLLRMSSCPLCVTPVTGSSSRSSSVSHEVVPVGETCAGA